MSTKNPFAPEFEDLPHIVPVFPLTGVLLLPGGRLPLNIFERRYLDMVDMALAGDRMIGIIQPRKAASDHEKPELSAVGCVGKIIEFAETEDGRYIIALSGISRFQCGEELEVTTSFRQIKPDWDGYEKDVQSSGCLDIDRERLHQLLDKYFDQQGMECDWAQIEQAGDARLITCLSMICPFDAQEKQGLLEAPSCAARAKQFMTMLEIAVCGSEECCKTPH